MHIKDGHPHQHAHMMGVRPHRQQPEQYCRGTKACLHIITSIPKQLHFSSFGALKLQIAVSSFSFSDILEVHELLWTKSQEKQDYCPDISTEHTGKTRQWLEACKPEICSERKKSTALDFPQELGSFLLCINLCCVQLKAAVAKLCYAGGKLERQPVSKGKHKGWTVLPGLCRQWADAWVSNCWWWLQLHVQLGAPPSAPPTTSFSPFFLSWRRQNTSDTEPSDIRFNTWWRLSKIKLVEHALPLAKSKGVHKIALCHRYPGRTAALIHHCQELLPSHWVKGWQGAIVFKNWLKFCVVLNAPHQTVCGEWLI